MLSLLLLLLLLLMLLLLLLLWLWLSASIMLSLAQERYWSPWVLHVWVATGCSCTYLTSHRLLLSSQLRIISVRGDSFACCRQQDYAADVRIASQGSSSIPSEALSFGEYSSDVFQSHASLGAQSNGTLQLRSSDLSMLPSQGTASLGSGTPSITQAISYPNINKKTFFCPVNLWVQVHRLTQDMSSPKTKNTPFFLQKTNCNHQDNCTAWLHRWAADDSMNWHHHYATLSRWEAKSTFVQHVWNHV